MFCSCCSEVSVVLICRRAASCGIVCELRKLRLLATFVREVTSTTRRTSVCRVLPELCQLTAKSAKRAASTSTKIRTGRLSATNAQVLHEILRCFEGILTHYSIAFSCRWLLSQVRGCVLARGVLRNVASSTNLRARCLRVLEE